MHRGDWQTLIVQEVVHHVALHLGVGEHKDTAWILRVDEVDQSLIFGMLVDKDDLLLNVLVRATDTTDLDNIMLA